MIPEILMKTKLLDRKVILVAGGAGGIGRETCKLFACRGATLVIADNDAKGLEPFLEEIKTQSPKSIAFQGDLSLWKTWEELVEISLNQFQRIDALIHCVGVLIPGSFEGLKESDILCEVGANFLSVVYGMKAVLPVMKRQRRGQVINIGSLGGIVPMPFGSLYSATKFGVRGLSLSLNEELRGTGVWVSLIEPSGVRTKMLDIEALDGQTMITFANSPLEALEVAKAILSTLESPRREVILPRFVGKLESALGQHPNLFSMFYPLIHLLGGVGLNRYRKKFLSKV